MKKTWIVIAMAAALCAACDDSKSDDKCVENNAICDNGQRFICTNGAYVAVPCASDRVCSEGSCVQMSDNECLTGALNVPQCESASALKYCSNGLVKTENCPANYVCNNAATGAHCVKSSNADTYACTPDSYRCTGVGTNTSREVCRLNGTEAAWYSDPCPDTQFCKEGKCVDCDSSIKNVRCNDQGNGVVLAEHCNNGKWETVDTCVTAQNMLCRSGACYDKFACSTEGALQCGDGNVIQTCQSGTWVTTSVCSTAGADRCYEGKCVDSSVPLPGDACDENKFTDVCSNNKVVYCYDSEITHYNCASSTCALITDSGETFGNCYDDTDVCTKAGETSQVCMYYSNGYILASATCMKANDGKLYKVAQQQTGTCASGCNDTYTDCDANGQGSSSGATCDYFDCGSYQCENDGTTCAKSCSNEYGSNYVALCDSESAYCVERAADKDSSCDSGQTAYTVESKVYCMTIGSEESCLTGGGSSSGDSGYYDCGSDCKIDSKTCDAYCSAEMADSKPFCYDYQNSSYLGCGASCSKEGQAGTACQEFSDGTYQYPTVCTKIGSNLIMVDNISAESDYKSCSNGCNTAGTACK